MSVSVFSALKNRAREGEVQALQGQVEKLTEARKALEDDLRLTQERYTEETLVLQDLKEELEQHRQQGTQNADSTSNQEASRPTANFTGSKTR